MPRFLLLCLKERIPEGSGGNFTGGWEEVRLRIGVRTKSLAEAQKLAPEVSCLVTCGPPNGSGYNLGRMPPQKILAYWPALMSKSFVKPAVSYKESRV